MNRQKYCLYRFKTEEEMIREFGYEWRYYAFPFFGWNNSMDHLLGKDFPLINEYTIVKDEDKFKYHDTQNRTTWTIILRMLTKNKPRVPNYEPKKFEKHG